MTEPTDPAMDGPLYAFSISGSRRFGLIKAGRWPLSRIKIIPEDAKRFWTRKLFLPFVPNDYDRGLDLALRILIMEPSFRNKTK